MPWMKIGHASKYAGVSQDFFETFVQDGLPYSQPRKVRLFKQEDIDHYLERHKVDRTAEAKDIADDIIGNLLRGGVKL